MEHNNLPFDRLHKAKFDSGLVADLPAVPEGAGDSYWAYDTQQLFLANAAADGWVIASGASSLSQLSDVDSTLSPSDGNTLYYDNASSEWKAGGGNLSLLSETLMVSSTSNPSFTGIDALGSFKYLMIDFSLRKVSGAGTTRSDRVIPININSGASLTQGMYQEWSDLGNNAGTATLSEAVLATNDAAASSVKSFGRIYVYSRGSGQIYLDCMSLYFTPTNYHKLCTQYYFTPSTSLDSIQFTGSFDSLSYIRLYGHRF